MDRENDRQTWVGNMFQRFEAVCHEVDEFVTKDSVKYVENHMQTVGESVKKFYSEVVQDFLLPPSVEPSQHAAEIIPSKTDNLAKTSTSSVVDIKEDTVDCNINKSEEAPLVPTEKCQERSITGLCHSEQISCEISGCHADDAESSSFLKNEGHDLINKTSAEIIQTHLNSSTSSQGNCEVELSSCKDVSSPECKNSSEAFVYHECDAENHDNDHSAKISNENHLDKTSFDDYPERSVFENADWGIEDIFDLGLVIDKVIEGDPPAFPSENVNIEENYEKVPMETFFSDLDIRCPQEKETLLNRSIDNSTSDLETLSIHQSSVHESSVTCNENKEERQSYDSSSSPIGNSLVDPDLAYSSSTESMGCFPAPSHSLSVSDSLRVIIHDNKNDSTRRASSSCTLSDGIEESAMVDDECKSMDTIDLSDKEQHMDTVDLSNKKQLVESCVIVKGQRIFSYPYGSRRSKSYKKIIQDAFTSRKRLMKEYEQIGLWYGDIDQEFGWKPPSNSIGSSAAQDLADSEWELL